MLGDDSWVVDPCLKGETWGTRFVAADLEEELIGWRVKQLMHLDATSRGQAVGLESYIGSCLRDGS